MSSLRPPRLASWLLEHMTHGITDDALAGDLLEEFNRRRSGAWYWRQVLAAIVASWAKAVRRHPALATQAVLITWAVNWAVLRVGRAKLPVARHLFHGETVRVVTWGICFLGGILSGAIIAALYRRRRRQVLLTGIGALAVWALGDFLLRRRGLIHHHPLRLAFEGVVYCLVALTGFAIGAARFSPATKIGTSPSEHASTTD